MFGAKAQLFLLVILVAIYGCGRQRDRWRDARPATAPVSGEVTFRGKPLPEAIVVFQPLAPGGIGASAVTDSLGRFVLRTFPPEVGAVPGKYSVSISKTEMPNPSTIERTRDDPEPVHVVSVIPIRYADPTESGLGASIPEEGADGLAFHLND